MQIRIVLSSPFIHSKVSTDSISVQWRPWSDCTNVQADLGLRCLLMPEDTFSHSSVTQGRPQSQSTAFSWAAKEKEMRKKQRQKHIQSTLVILEVQGTLWNTSRYPYLDISDLQNWEKKINGTSSFQKWICNLTPEVRDILKILWKSGEISPLFHNILLPLVWFPC